MIFLMLVLQSVIVSLFAYVFIMQKKGNWDRDCMICKQPFCVVKWLAVCGCIGETELCHTCSELENVCEVCGQVCQKNEHGFLPVRLNETAADIRANIAISSHCPSRELAPVKKEVFIVNLQRMVVSFGCLCCLGLVLERRCEGLPHTTL
ncbi:hypothetical protein IFM89_031296 [Coptis chinensis]|uniref:Uncharacterized protein n=1 Tax=Coptis chinensis TaxID=261450 RepID=A0A835MGD5_9MAGN|nr:hypothetical protein IFM89_021617 [Coptis chinensis]KAF9626169.1 hypothetical protein IFM89_031296 [Coptis chinensis]